MVLVFEFGAYVLARKQMLYHLSHTSTLFCCGYFGSRVSLLAQADPDQDPPILSFFPSLE
jgi:hypothetical protein